MPHRRGHRRGRPTEDLFELEKIGDGVIVGDSHSKPSAARAVYQQIHGVAKAPVRKIANTHVHRDHWQGNEVYTSSSSGIEVIASERTRGNLIRPDAGNGGVAAGPATRGPRSTAC